MRARRRLSGAALALALLPLAALADAMAPPPGFATPSLFGDWYEVASTPNFIERDCHGTTVSVAPRSEDSLLVMKIACHKGRVAGPVLSLDALLAGIAPGRYALRFVRLSQLGNLELIVLWQSAAGDVLALGAPDGAVGWVWSRSVRPKAAALAAAEHAMVAAGYVRTAIRPVDQGN